ncbi:MAG TPA: amino acid ABC transporter permease [Caldisericia bacterium]|nr:amino acid ABC transporter permease [Caldisericia bacterium]HPB33288.1 amino acid ABC transporter permease [Caldisericia bacterium]HQL66465.1 amino acid ABC transporter permease [Caldisericia bacterium]HQN48212.1 amino acid ABC transporter permease [Caldisericia bacterium]HQO99251.1 amino acid ABC transporter permease [Caldisericia bacterium]
MKIFDFSVFSNIDAIKYILSGIFNTIFLTFTGIGIGLICGSLLTFGEVYLPSPLNFIFRIFGEIIRGIPLTVLFLILYLGFNLGALTSAIVGLGIRSAAYQSQIFRSSLEAIPQGQLLAALSIGLKKGEVFLYILLPQAIKIMIPSWSNEFITLLKDTSIAFVLGITEIMTRAELISRAIGRYFEIYIFIAVIYFIMVRGSNYLLNLMYEKNKIPGLGERG